MFGGFFNQLSGDPFFDIQDLHNRMMDPFQMMGFGGMGQSPLMPFGLHNNMNSLMDSFKQDMNAGQSHSFSSSHIMTMTSGPDGRPQYYQASSSTRTAPGGVKETKKSVCDSQSGTKRMAIGRHIGERGHVRERLQNIRSGEREETEDFINIEEDEAEGFNREWTQKARNLSSRQPGMHSIEFTDNRRPRALMPSATSTRSRYRPTSYSSQRYIPSIGSSPANSYSRAADDGPIIEEVDDEEEVVVEKTRKRERQRSVPEITEVVDNSSDSSSSALPLPRKIKMRSRKFEQKSKPQ